MHRRPSDSAWIGPGPVVDRLCFVAVIPARPESETSNASASTDTPSIHLLAEVFKDLYPSVVRVGDVDAITVGNAKTGRKPELPWASARSTEAQ